MGGDSCKAKKPIPINETQPNSEQNTQNNLIEINNSEKSTDSKRVISAEEENVLDMQFIKLKTSKILPIANCSYIDNDKTHWQVIFLGTESTPYENGYFKIELIFNNVFPKNGPEAKFITKMFHPNISANGHVCMDLLNYWNEKTSMEDVIYGILEILDNPVPENGYNNEARKLLEENYEKYMETVDEYTAKYAMEGF